MTNPLPISATFLDEVSGDIAGHNWGAAEWRREFQTFADSGIDTVVMIRGGSGPRLSHPSPALSRLTRTLPVYLDYAELFLNLSDEHGMEFFFGLYDSNWHWVRMDWKTEVQLNRVYVRDVWERYGHHPSFAGWYLPHETFDTGRRIMDLNCALAEVCLETADLQTLTSPYWFGRDEMHNNHTGGLARPHDAEEMLAQWDEILGRYSGLVNTVAFQDGTVPELELPTALAQMRQLTDAYGLTLWTNVESFDRDMPIQFLPIEWRKLVNKLHAAQPYVEKAITFEFSHFMSPNSMWPSAHALFNRYREYLDGGHLAIEGGLSLRYEGEN